MLDTKEIMKELEEKKSKEKKEKIIKELKDMKIKVLFKIIKMFENAGIDIKDVKLIDLIKYFKN